MKKNLKIPIGFKLVSITATLLIAATLLVIFIATKLFSDDFKLFIQSSNSEISEKLSKQTHHYFSGLVSTLTTITEIQNQSLGLVQKTAAIKLQYERNEEILSVTTWSKNSTRPEASDFSKTADKIKNLILDLKPSPKAWLGQMDIKRITLNGEGYIALSFPLVVDSSKNVIKCALGILNQSKLVQMYGKKGVGLSYLVDKEGNVLAHPDSKVIDQGSNFKDVEIVNQMMSSNETNKTMTFIDRDGRSYLGVFRKVGVGEMGVITQLPEDIAYTPVKEVKKRATLAAGIILFLSFSFIYFFSKTLTKPIHSLVDLTREIAKGNFKIKVNPKGRDEITDLTKSFGQMAMGLAERDKLKETFNKFHSKEIAEAILKGEIKLGGSRQKATVFFSDIRGFTSLSEELSAEQVVEMLNEYMTAMVSEITFHKGVVDKYVGDAIMAVWGAPIPKPDDTWNAVRACLAMRSRLEKFNAERIKAGKKPIKMGMGLHSGELIAGNIGSNEKMEYTVIGDTVNTASRIESMTKEFGTDLLISEEVYLQIKDRLIVESVSAGVKGKSKAIKAYKVQGYYDESKNPVLIQTPYSSYEAEHSEKVKVS